MAVNAKPSRLPGGTVPASLRFLATQVADIAHHDNQPRGRGQRRRAVFSPAQLDLGAALSPVAALSERRRQQCGLGRNGEPALQEGLAGRDWGVDRRDLAERVGNRLFHIPVPPDDQLALLLVLGDRGRDHVER